MIRQRVNQHARVGSNHDLHALSGIDEQFRNLSDDVGSEGPTPDPQWRPRKAARDAAEQLAGTGSAGFRRTGGSPGSGVRPVLCAAINGAA